MSEPAIQIEVIGKEQLAEIGGFAPNHVFHKQIERSAQIRGERAIKLRETGGVFG